MSLPGGVATDFSLLCHKQDTASSHIPFDSSHSLDSNQISAVWILPLQGWLVPAGFQTWLDRVSFDLSFRVLILMFCSLILLDSSMYIVLFYGFNKPIHFLHLLVTVIIILFMKSHSSKWMLEYTQIIFLLSPPISSCSSPTLSTIDLYILRYSHLFQILTVIPNGCNRLVVVRRSTLSGAGCIWWLLDAPCEFGCT